jgi:hypothetical protein
MYILQYPIPARSPARPKLYHGPSRHTNLTALVLLWSLPRVEAAVICLWKKSNEIFPQNPSSMGLHIQIQYVAKGLLIYTVLLFEWRPRPDEAD